VAFPPLDVQPTSFVKDHFAMKLERVFRANLFLKLALILSIVAGNTTFATSAARANETGAPTNVTAVALQGKSAIISWTVPTNAADLGIVSYNVELPGYLSDNNNLELCTVPISENTTRYSCTLENLPTENQSYLSYFFYVVAGDVNGRNISLGFQNSNEVTIYDAPQAPSVPRNVMGVAGTNSIRVFWQTPAFNGASPITSYTAEIIGGSASCTATPILIGYQNCTINGLNNGQSYTFTVVATNAIGRSTPGNSQRSVTPFVGNFDGFDTNSFDNYVDGHQQVRNLPSGKSLYNLRCESSANTFDFTLETIDTQNSNYLNPINLSFSDIDYSHDLTCNTQTAAGPNGVFITISNPSESETMLYNLNPATGEANDIALISFPNLSLGWQGKVLGVTQDQSGILRVLFLTSDNNNPFGFPQLNTGVINSTTGAVETSVMVAQDLVVPLFDFESVELEEELLPLGELDLPDSDLISFFPDAGKIILYKNNSSTTGSDLVMGGLDGSGKLTESYDGDLLEPLDAFIQDEDPLDFLFNPNSPIIPTDYLNLLRDLFSYGPTSFSTYQNQAYLLTGGQSAGRIASLFSLNLTSGHLEAVADFPASSMPLGDGYLSTATTIDSNGIIWNLSGGVLQSESISGFQNVGDYQVALTNQSDSANQPSSDSNSIFVASSVLINTPPPPSNTAPGAPTTVVAKTTGKRSATVSFAPPSSDGGSPITSYTITSNPGGITKILTQANGGTFTFDNLQPGTEYTFAVTATNAIGASAATISNSIKTMPLEVASISALSFVDDGSGTGGKIVWSGKGIDSVLYTGPENLYPGPYNYGAFTSSWNGRIRNLEPDKSYTISIFAVSADGVGESKSLTFKTSAALPVLAGSVNTLSTTSSSARSTSTELVPVLKWIEENTFVPGEGANMSNLLTKFDALVTSPHRAYIKVPTSRVTTITATSLTPKACSVVSASAKVDAGLVTALSGDKCTISYTVTGGSNAPATLVKDFIFKKFVK
jgi:hypothetical protein